MRAPSPRTTGTIERFEATDALTMLRTLVAATEGEERLELQRRLYQVLLERRDRSARTEARAVLDAMAVDPAFPGWYQADETLFDRATLVSELHDPAARDAWQRLVAAYPTSSLAPAAHVALGDLAFDAADLFAAEREYQAVLATDDRGRDYARYKLGWVHLNLGRNAEALADFVDVVRRADDPLRREALKDAVRAYADVGDPTKALAFFDALERGRGPAMTARLAALYGDQGRLDQAALAYRAAIPGLDDAGACAAIGELDALAMRYPSSRELADARTALAAWSADCKSPP